MKRHATLTARAGLTLIELLVVVAILAILSAIAMPSAFEARTRAKVAQAKSNLRVLGDAIEAYHVDFGQYPPGRPTPGVDPFGVFATFALGALTTPVAYAFPAALKDPFGPMQRSEPIAPGLSGGRGSGDRPFPSAANTPSFLFFNYLQFGALRNNPRLMAHAYAIISVGPDQRDSFAVFAPFPDELPAEAQSFGVYNAADTLYDPTNGARSPGDIGRWGGSLPSVPRP